LLLLLLNKLVLLLDPLGAAALQGFFTERA